MTKRRVINNLCFNGKNVVKAGGQLPIAVVAAGTGTIAQAGVFTVLAGAVATRVYLTVVASTNIGTLVGSA